MIVPGRNSSGRSTSILPRPTITGGRVRASHSIGQTIRRSSSCAGSFRMRTPSSPFLPPRTLWWGIGTSQVIITHATWNVSARAARRPGFGKTRTVREAPRPRLMRGLQRGCDWQQNTGEDQMGNKSNKLYVIVDEEEGVILINMDRTNPARPVVAATHTLVEMNNDIKIDSVKAVEFATEFNNHPNTNLRRFLV